MSLTPDVDGMCISIFKSLQLEGLYVGDLDYSQISYSIMNT